MIKHILVPVDGSEPSHRALTYGADLAKALGASLHVITVLDLGQLDFYDGIYMGREQIEAWQGEVRKRILDRALATLPADKGAAQATVLEGPVAKTIQDYAEANHVDLIVMGRTGKGALARMVEGSVSRRMAATCPIPLTIVG